MAFLFGKEVSKEFLMKRIGDISQVAGIKRYELKSGKAKGVDAFDVKTGTGFNFTVLPSRGMDIAWADYKGIPISFISKTGIVAPEYYNDRGDEFSRSFYAGLLTTCGTRNLGKSCIDDGEYLGLHGRISNTPAYDISVYSEWEKDEFIMKLRGKMRESILYGENIVITREIISKLGEKKLYIKDIIENCGFKEEPLMLLYHCNFGYPIVSEDTELFLPEGDVIPRDDKAKRMLERYKIFESPTNNYPEIVFYHDLKMNESGKMYACLYNKTLEKNGLGAYVKFNKNQLPNLTEWKQMGEGDYVVALEPGTWYPEPRAKVRKEGNLLFIQPSEKKKVEIEIGVITSIKDLNTI
jgi:hypothetical protein